MCRSLALVLLAGCSAAGCQSADPGQCQPACQNGETCVEGRCSKTGLDGGPRDGLDRSLVDGATDRLKADGAAPSYAMLSKQCKGEVSSNAVTPGLVTCKDGTEFKLEVKANGTDKYMFLLNAPDTWIGASAWKTATFRIVDVDVDGSTKTTIASGGFDTMTHQRIPTTIMGVKKLTAGTHSIEVWFGGAGPESLYIGGTGGAWLVALPAPESDLQAIHGPAAQQETLSTSWTDLSLSTDPGIEIRTSEQAGKYLLFLNAMASTGGMLQMACFQVLVNTKAVSYGCFSSGVISQRIPVTLVGWQDLALGDKVKVQWHIVEKTGWIAKADGTEWGSWLIALRSPKGVGAPSSLSMPGSWSTSYQMTGSSTAGPIGGLAPLDVLSDGGDHLVILNVSFAWTNLVAWPAAHYQVDIAGNAELQGFVSSRTSGDSQHVPITMIGVKKLPFAGSHSKVEALWNIQACNWGCTPLAKLTQARLIAFTR